MILARVMKTSRVSSLAIRSSSRWRKRVSTSVSPWCFSGGGRSDLASSSKPSSLQRELAAAGAEDGAVGADQVAEVEREQALERLLAEHVEARVQLHPAGAVDEVEERRLALAAAGGEPAGDADAVLGLLAVGQRVVGRLDLGDRAHPGVSVRERVDALLAQRLELAPPGGEQLRGLLLAHARRLRSS